MPARVVCVCCVVSAVLAVVLLSFFGHPGAFETNSWRFKLTSYVGLYTFYIFFFFFFFFFFILSQVDSRKVATARKKKITT